MRGCALDRQKARVKPAAAEAGGSGMVAWGMGDGMM